MKLIFIFISLFIITAPCFCQDYKLGEKFFFIKNFINEGAEIKNSSTKIWLIDSVFDLGHIQTLYGAKLKNGKDSFYCSFEDLESNIDGNNIMPAADYFYYLKKFGKLLLYKLAGGKIWVGITAEQAIIAKGKPSSINTTVTKNIKHEQWVYGDDAYLYLYFSNGILTSYQY